MNFSFAPDIDEQIQKALQYIFNLELITNTTDILELKTLKVAPLQDDPTLVAPYLTYGPDFEKGMELVTSGRFEREYGSAEIGGPQRFVHYWTATVGTPFTSTRETCLAQIANLTTRVSRVLIHYYDLSNTIMAGMLMSADQSVRIEGANPLLIDKIRKRLEGGEQTWFGQGIVEWHYPVVWYP
jgi:hypothetical protein